MQLLFDGEKFFLLLCAWKPAFLKSSHICLSGSCFWGLSDIHEYPGCFQMATYPIDKHIAGCNSIHDWLMSLAMDLAALCDIWSWKRHQWMPFGCFQLRCSLCLPLHGYPSAPNSHPVGVLVILATLVNKLSNGIDLIQRRTREWHALESNPLSTKIWNIHHQVWVNALMKYAQRKHL